jgi:hypothetical protein
MPKKATTVEAANPEHDRLIEALKFTPRTYKIQIWGYGGEYIMGTVDRKIWDYFRRRRLDLSDFAWDSDYAEDHNIPEEMWPFPPGSYYDCDDLGHIHGVDRSAGTLQILDENEETVYEKNLDDISGYGDDTDNPEPEWGGGEEVWIGSQPPGTVVFLGVSSEKGTFFEGHIELKQPFNPGKLTLCYDEFDGNDIITRVQYDGEDIDNWGGDTNGKGSDMAFYLVKNSNTFQKYTNMDDIEYTMTDWFPKKIRPVQVGQYMIKTAGRNSWEHRALWTGTRWVSGWTEEADYDTADEVKIKEWRGIAYDPDEQFLRDELDRIYEEFPMEAVSAEQIDKLEKVNCTKCDWSGMVDETFDTNHEMICPVCNEPVEFTN